MVRNFFRLTDVNQLEMIVDAPAPPFDPMPDAVVWKDRTFKNTGRAVVAPDGARYFIYRETVTFVIPD